MLSPSFLHLTRALAAGSLLLAAACHTPTGKAPVTPAAPTVAPAAPAAVGAFDDDPRPPTAAENLIVAAGLDPAKLAAAERELLAIMQKPDADPATVQEAAQQLGLILLTGPGTGHAATLNALAPMLADPVRVDCARLALDRVPGTAVDALYLQALLRSSGRARLGLIDSVATRGIAGAVPALAGLLDDADPATARAAASALGRIGGPAALEALARAKDPLAPAVLKARLAAAAQADAATAARIAGEIHRNTAAPLGQRAAALRQLLAAHPAGAIEEIHSALSGGETAFHATAIESVATLPVADAGAKLAARLGAYAPAVQVSLIAALGNRNEAGAVPGLLLMLDSAEAGVRLAALDALGRLPGTPAVAHRLAALAAGRGDEAQAASAALARLDGPGLDDLVRTGAATEGDNALRAVFIRQIAARNLTEAIPFLLGLRQSPVESLRLEALDALRLIAAPSDQQSVIAWALGAAGRSEQTRAVRALIAIILRDGAVETRAAAVIAALDAADAAGRQILLPVLSRVAGAPALAAAAKLARDTDAAVAAAAANELARWPDASVLPLLVDLAGGTPLESVRNTAVQGAARFLSQSGGIAPARRSAQARALIALPLETAARQSLIHVLSLCADQAALDTARRFLADPAVAAAAQDAVDAITSNLAGPPTFAVSAEADASTRMSDGRKDTCWSVPNEAGSWLRADLHNSRPVRKLILDQGQREWDWPGEVEVFVSDDPEQPGEVRAKAEGERYQTVVTLPAGVRGRYLWIRQTGKRGNAWSVAELVVE
ncbi:MAG: HEAT repeat domain-containing protein [Verrucomicrobiota bacterium]